MEQSLFNFYSYMVVGILGNALIAWELGKKGWIRLGLEGPKNRKVLFALICFIVMISWQAVRRLDSTFTSWGDMWILAWAFSVFVTSHFLVPKSMRLYSRAKFLHETTYVGDWRRPESEVPLEQIRTNWRLLKAKSLYLKALQIQKRLSDQSQTDRLLIHHQRNVAVTYCQLALLYLQQRYFVEAAQMASEAIKIAELLRIKSPNDPELLSTLSDAFFRAAEVEQMQGRLESAMTKYERSLAIDRSLQNEQDVKVTEARIKEIADLGSTKRGRA